MKPTPSGASVLSSSRRYPAMTSASACTSESKLNAKSTDPSSIMSSDRPSFTWYAILSSPANRSRQASMQAASRSTIDSVSQCSRRNAVQRPWPGAISRIDPAGRNRAIRGRTTPYHWAWEPPQPSDHSSPASAPVVPRPERPRSRQPSPRRPLYVRCGYGGRPLVAQRRRALPHPAPRAPRSSRATPRANGRARRAAATHGSPRAGSPASSKNSRMLAGHLRRVARRGLRT